MNNLMDHEGEVNVVVFSPNSSLLATGADDREINVYNVTNNFSLLFTLDEHTGIVWTLSFSPESTRLVSGSGDGTIRLWNPTAGTLLETVKQRAHMGCQCHHPFAQREPGHQLRQC